MSIKIYLAGKMGGLTFEQMNRWRKSIKDDLINCASYTNIEVNVINPVDYYNFKEKKHQTEIEVEEYNLAHVRSSDIILVNLEGLSDSIGTIIELHDAHYHYKIPVIAFGKQELYDCLHPWIKNDITRVEKNGYDAVTYIRDFYLI